MRTNQTKRDARCPSASLQSFRAPTIHPYVSRQSGSATVGETVRTIQTKGRIVVSPKGGGMTLVFYLDSFSVLCMCAKHVQLMFLGRVTVFMCY